MKANMIMTLVDMSSILDYCGHGGDVHADAESGPETYTERAARDRASINEQSRCL